MEVNPAPFLTELSDGVLTLTLNRPDHGNAMPPEAVPDMVDLFRSAQDDRSVRCIVIRGKGKHFTTGADVNRFARGVAEGAAALQADFRKRMRNVEQLVLAMVGFDRPIVAQVRGGVAGAGLLYTLVADFVFADNSSFFLFAHQRMALNPDAGVSWLLPRVVGVRAAKRLILSASRADVDEALRLGLVTRLVAAEDLAGEVDRLAARLAKAPQHAIRKAKQLIDGASSTSLADQLRAEGEAVVTAVGDPDFAEAVTSFVEKRSPIFPSVQ